MKIAIFDLDGTLANLNHRLQYVKSNTPDWDTFYKECINDSVNYWCKELMANLYWSYQIIILSGRRKECLADTQDWLKKNEIIHHELYLIGDSRSRDEDLKKKWIQEFDRASKVEFIVDDRQRVVDMWRKEGFTCLQCAKWDEYKKEKI